MALRFGFKRLRYFFVVFSTNNGFFPYLLLVGLMVVVVVVGMGAYFFGLMAPESIRAEGIDNSLDAGFIDTFWWSFKHVLDPGAFAKDYGAPISVLVFGVFTTIAGLVITGALIGFIINFIQTGMDELKRGSTVIHEMNHVLILGWNRKVVSILRFFSELRTHQPIVILTNADIDDVNEEIRQERRSFRNVRVVPQHGSPTVAAELKRVNVANSASVVLLAEEQTPGRDQSPDISTIKSLMLLDNIAWEGKKPNIVAEIAEKDNVRVANIAVSARAPIVSSTEFVSKTLVQCARHTGYSRVYSQLFSFDKNEILIHHVEGLSGELFGNVARRFEKAILLGVSWVQSGAGGARRVAVLNPEPDYDLGEDDELIFLAASRKQLSTPLEMTNDEASGASIAHFENPKMRRVLILGWNENIGQIVEEIDGHANEPVDVAIASGQNAEFFDEYTQRHIAAATRNVQLTHIQEDTATESALRRLEVQKYDVIILVADHSQPGYDPDSRTTLTLLLLRELRGEKGRAFPRVVAEFYDKESHELCRETPLTDAVMSPEFVSMQITHLAREPVLASIYNELLSAGGIEIGLRPIERYVPLRTHCSFAQLVRATQNANEIVLGVRIGGIHGELSLNPGSTSRFVFEEGDVAVVLAQEVYI